MMRNTFAVLTAMHSTTGKKGAARVWARQSHLDCRNSYKSQNDAQFLITGAGSSERSSGALKIPHRPSAMMTRASPATAGKTAFLGASDQIPPVSHLPVAG